MTLLMLSLFTSLYSYAQSPEFACYQAMSAHSSTDVLFNNGKAGIEPVTAYSFRLVTPQGIQLCEVPSDAPSNPEDRKGEPRALRVSVRLGKQTFLLAYRMKNIALEEGGDPKNYPAARCSPESARNGWKELLEKTIARVRQECDDPDMGMTSSQNCLPAFIEAIAPCEKVPSIKTYAFEIKRSAQAQVDKRPGARLSPPSSAPATGR